MRRLPFLISIFLAGVASAAADIVDVRELGNGHQPDVFILFDETPTLVDTRTDGRVIELDIAANLEGPRRIEPARSRWISSIETLTTEGQQTIRLELLEGAEGVEVVRTLSGLRLTWTPVAVHGRSVVQADMITASDGSAAEPVVFADEVARTPTDLLATTPDHEADHDVTTAVEQTARPEDDLVQPSAGDNACAAASAALELDSWDIDALTVSASCQLDAGNTQVAITMLERVIAFEPGRFDAVIALAEANEEVGNIESARILYEQAAMVAATDGQAVAARARARRLTN